MVVVGTVAMVVVVVVVVVIIMMVIVVVMVVMVVMMIPEELDQSQNLFQRRSQAGLVHPTTSPDHLRYGKKYH